MPCRATEHSSGHAQSIDEKELGGTRVSGAANQILSAGGAYTIILHWFLLHVLTYHSLPLPLPLPLPPSRPPHLLRQPYTPCVPVEEQQPLGEEARVVRVHALHAPIRSRA